MVSRRLVFYFANLKIKLLQIIPLKDLSKLMGIAEFKLGNSIPEKIKTVFPFIEELEDELSSK